MTWTAMTWTAMTWTAMTSTAMTSTAMTSTAMTWARAGLGDRLVGLAVSGPGHVAPGLNFCLAET